MLVTLLAGCFFITDAEHAARLAAADTRGADTHALVDDTDTGDTGDVDTADTGDVDTADTADTDTADTDTADTDTDTSDTDTGPPTGTLRGSIQITVEGTLTGTDTCVGDVLVDLDPDELLGTFDCDFGGSLYQDQFGRFEGDGRGGLLTFQSSFSTSGAWTGTLGRDEPVTLTGSFRFEDVPGTLGNLTVSGFFSASADE